MEALQKAYQSQKTLESAKEEQRAYQFCMERTLQEAGDSIVKLLKKISDLETQNNNKMQE